MRPLLIATRNAHKTREIRAILGEQFEVLDLNAFPDFPDTEESGETFRANAVLKALAASRVFEGLVLSDDSGLEVDALAGAPGVRSARYAGEPPDDARNREKLLAELEKIGARGKKRRARFRCVIALARNGEVIQTFEESVGGVIVNQPKGDGGFGYDPLFVPDGYCETFAQLSPDVKNLISHRARALQNLRFFFNETKFSAANSTSSAPRPPTPRA